MHDDAPAAPTLSDEKLAADEAAPAPFRDDHSDNNIAPIGSAASRVSSHIEGMLDPTPPWDVISLPHEIIFVLLLCLAQLFTQASVAQTIATNRAIPDTFGVTSPGEMSWFSAAYSLTVGTFILVAGRLGDMFGLKRIYVLGMLWYAIGSLLCGVSSYAKSSVFFAVCRALQGIGPAFINPAAVGIIGSYYPMGPRRVFVMCCFGGVAPSGFVVGSVFCGLFTQLAGSWPWVFYAQAIACTVVAGLAAFVFPRNIGAAFAEKQVFDYWGAITGVTGLILFNFAWNQGPVVGWHVPYVYILLIVGIAFILLFLYVERRVAHPLIPPAILRGDTGAILGCIACGWSSFGIWVFYLHQFGFLIEDRTMLNMTARIAVLGLVGIAAGLTTALLLPRVPSSFIMLASTVAFCAGSLLMALRPTNQIYWALMFVSLLCMPFGMDMSFPASTVIISSNLPREQQGVAGSIVNTVVNYSISIGLGIAGTVEYYSTTKLHQSEYRAIRNSQWTGTGLAGFSIFIALWFVFLQVVRPKMRASKTVSVPVA